MAVRHGCVGQIRSLPRLRIFVVVMRMRAVSATDAHIFRLSPHSQVMSERGMKFTIASTGAVSEGVTVRYVSATPDGLMPWALFGMSIADMLTPAGIAWIEFVLAEGGGGVFPLVAPVTLDTAAGVWTVERHGVSCRMADGGVYLDHEFVRESTDRWGAGMAAGERVRLVYVDATRMVSVVWRGASIDLVVLPAAHNIAVTRFGIALDIDNVVRITGASAGAWACAGAVRIEVISECTRVCWRTCTASRTRRTCELQRTSSFRTWDLSCAPA